MSSTKYGIELIYVSHTAVQKNARHLLQEEMHMVKPLHHYINGRQVEGTSGRYGDVFNPTTGEVTARVPLASADETARAI